MPLLVRTNPEAQDPVDGSTVGEIIDATGEVVDTVALPASEDADEWRILADAALSTAGYRLAGAWVADTRTCLVSAAIERPWLTGEPFPPAVPK
jgi:hypothetical protein